MGRRFYTAFEYDFNNPVGTITMHRDTWEDFDFSGDTEVMLVSLDGDLRQPGPRTYDGFGCMTKVTEVREVPNSDYVIVQTDYRAGQ